MESTTELQTRLRYLTLATLAVVFFGVAGFWVLGRVAGGSPSVLECAYHAVITLATVGSREMHPVADVWYGQLFIISLVLMGMGLLLALATSVTAFLVEGEILNIFRRRKMDKTLQEMENHFVVCGAGATGTYVIEELLGTGNRVVLVEKDQERIDRLLEHHTDHRIPYVRGPAADDEVLEKAGLDRARGIVVAVPDIRDNLYIVVTAKQLRPDLKVVARATNAADEQRLLRVGADSVVSPARIGGMRMASEMVRPQVTSFLDNMLRGQDKPLRIEEIGLAPSCTMVGKPLRETNLRHEADLLVLAIRDAAHDAYLYNPPSDTVLEAGTTLIVLGPVESVHRIRSQMQ